VSLIRERTRVLVRVGHQMSNMQASKAQSIQWGLGGSESVLGDRSSISRDPMHEARLDLAMAWHM
jgi:hypothetical protein